MPPGSVNVVSTPSVAVLLAMVGATGVMSKPVSIARKSSQSIFELLISTKTCLTSVDAKTAVRNAESLGTPVAISEAAEKRYGSVSSLLIKSESRHLYSVHRLVELLNLVRFQHNPLVAGRLLRRQIDQAMTKVQSVIVRQFETE